MKPIILKGHKFPIKCLKFNKDNDLLFSASTDRLITMWSSEYGERIGTYMHKAAVYTLSIDSNTKYVVSGDSNGMVYLWEASNGTLLKKIYLNNNPRVQCVDFDHQNQSICVAYDKRGKDAKGFLDIYKLSDILSAKENERGEANVVANKSTLLPNKDVVTNLKWTDNDKIIICSSEGGNLYRYSLDSFDKPDLVKNVHSNIIEDMDISPNQELLLTASKDGKAKVVNPDTFEVMTELFPQNPVRNINVCIFSPLISEEDEGKRKFHAFIAGGQESRDVTTTTTKKGGFETLIYDYMFGEELGAILGHFGPVNALAITSDGEILATGSEESSVRLHKINYEEYNSLERK